MGFTIAPDVMVAKDRGPSRQFVGYAVGKPEIKYTVGRFGFANPISATVFSYLNFHKDVTQSCAQLCVHNIEKKMSRIGALSSLNELSVSSVVNMVIPYGKLLEAGTKLTGFAADAYRDTKLSATKADTAAMNPHTPKENITWTGDMTAEYVDYAVAYWKVHPGLGPAYKIGANV